MQLQERIHQGILKSLQLHDLMVFGIENPEGPGIEKIILARTHEKTIPPRTKFSFSLEIFILGLKFSFSIENFNPRPCFSAAREGPGMKKPFSIENFIPY